MNLPESSPGVRDKVRAAYERVQQAMLPSWDSEASMPFGLSKRRLEVNLSIVGSLSFIPEVEREKIKTVSREVLADGYTETGVSFYIGERDGKSVCYARQHLANGEWFDKG